MLDLDIRRALDEEYSETLKVVSEAREGDEKAKWQLQKLAELHKQRMSEEQTGEENYFRFKELELKTEQLKVDKFDRVVKIVLDGVAIVVPCAVSSYWMGKGLKFEETGSFTSRVGTWVSSHLRLFKK